MSTKRRSRSAAFIAGMSACAFCGLSDIPKRVTFTWCAAILSANTPSFFSMSSSSPGHCFQYVSRPTETTPTLAVSGLRRATRGESANAAPMENDTINVHTILTI